MALLCVHDDGSDDGELIRLRSERVVIGRGEGDVVIPHDNMMSGRHAELSRQLEEGRSRWFLTDLQSTNGTYVRVSNAILKHGQDVLLGSRRYRFQAALQDVHAAETEDPAKGTQGWQSVSPADLIPSLVELVSATETGRRYPLPNKENWLGRDPRVAGVVIADDPLISPRHARLYQGRKGRWHIENAGSVNGVWLRVQHLALEGICYFQLGEQRFSVRIL
jgi:pSer/pThr/pTyr-binding forkhead associated (FHA) protein